MQKTGASSKIDDIGFFKHAENLGYDFAWVTDSMETWGGFHVRRTPFGGELHRLGKDDTDRLIRLPFAKSETTTALQAPAPAAPVIAEPSPEARSAIADVAKQFTVDKRGQGDFGF